MLAWPDGRDWAGLRLKADLIVKDITHPLRWACRQSLNDDGPLTLRRNLRS